MAPHEHDEPDDDDQNDGNEDVPCPLTRSSGLGRRSKLAQALTPEEERHRVWYVALLRHVGCTADAHAMAEIVGDDIAFHAGAMVLDASSPKALGPFMLSKLVRDNGLIGAAGTPRSGAGARLMMG